MRIHWIGRARFLRPLLLGFLLAFAGRQRLEATVLQPPITNPANGHLYYLISDESWTASEAEAVSLGGHLVTINDAAEQAWVLSTFGSAGSLWIGLNDAAREGTFRWSSGETSSFTQWYPGEPNASTPDEDYVLMYWQGFGDPYAGKWNDISNTNQYTPLGVVEVVPGSAAISFDRDATAVAEDAGSVTLRVLRTGSPAISATAILNIGNTDNLATSVDLRQIGSFGIPVASLVTGVDTAQAVAGRDYTFGDTLTINFAPGEVVKEITVPILNAGVNGRREFAAQLFAQGTGISVGSIPMETVQILDSEFSLRFHALNQVQAEEISGGRSFSAAATVENAGDQATGPVRVKLVATAGFIQPGTTTPPATPADIVLGTFDVSSGLAPGTLASVNLSGICPDPSGSYNTYNVWWWVYAVIQEEAGGTWFDSPGSWFVVDGERYEPYANPYILAGGTLVGQSGTGALPAFGTPPELASVAIAGPAELAGGSTGQFSASATFSNGSAASSFTPVWSSNLFAISAAGRLSTTPVPQATSCNVRLTVTLAGVTKTAVKSVTVDVIAPTLAAATASGVHGTAFRYQIAAANFPSLYGASGALPAGLTLDTASGVISGTPGVSGVFTVPITVQNSAGSASALLTIDLAPQITTPALAIGTAGQPLTIALTSPDAPTATGVTGTLPAGLVYSAGSISGTPAESGVFDVTLSATNAGGTATAPLRIQISPENTSAPGQTGLAGQLFQYQIQSASAGVTFSAADLPDWLTLDPATGLLSGTPPHPGTYVFEVSVSDAGGTTTLEVTANIKPLLTIDNPGTGHGVVSGAVLGNLSIPLATQSIVVPVENDSDVALTATAAAGSFFGGWSGDFSSPEVQIQFHVTDSTTVHANFGKLTDAQGSYAALVNGADGTVATSGYLGLVISKTGAWTATFKYGGTAYPLHGRFAADGSSSASFRRHELELALRLQPGDGAPSVSAQVLSAAAPLSGGTARRAGYDAAHHFTGGKRFTALLIPPGDAAAAPQGIGVAVVTIDALGRAHLVGTSSDGAAVTAGGFLLGDNTWPLFAAPANANRLLSGVVTFRDQPMSDFDGQLISTRFVGKPLAGVPPALFPVQLFGSAYKSLGAKAPVLSLPPSAAFPAPDLAGLQACSIRLANGNHVAEVTPAQLTFSATPGNGRFTGSFPDPTTGKRLHYKGVVFQKAGTGAGLFSDQGVWTGIFFTPF